MAGFADSGGGGSGFGDWFAQVQQEEAHQASGDVEAGLGGLWAMLSQSTSNEKKHDGGGDPAESQGFLESASQAFKRMGGGGSEATQSKTETLIMGLSYQTRFKGFVASVALSNLFFFLAFMIGLPVILLRPHKFALLFTMGSLGFMFSFSFLKGPTAHLKSMCAAESVRFTAAWIGSMLATIYAALVVRSYVLVVLTSSVQITSLAFYLVSSIPGGTRGLEIALRVFIRGFNVICSACWKTIRACAGPCCGLQC